ncbi:MAG: hypothetical protein AB7V13_21080 [Pseudorhodoplanes sp.]
MDVLVQRSLDDRIAAAVAPLQGQVEADCGLRSPGPKPKLNDRKVTSLGQNPESNDTSIIPVEIRVRTPSDGLLHRMAWFRTTTVVERI